jgi:two-component system, LuxR family, sensor kinase FixL
MNTAAEMIIEDPPSDMPLTAAPSLAPDGLAAREAPAALHGRLLNVSRMATIGEMAAGVAHELNQPLTAIANYAHACERLLSRPEADSADVREALRQITVQTTRAADILRRLRALARSQRAEHAPADINALVTELHEVLHTDAVVHGVQLTLELAPELPEVMADPGQIQQVILNLVRNSLDALAGRAAGGGQIAIRTALSAAGEVQLSVCDNGPGISAEAMKRIFDPFFSTKENGTGLGLAITHTIVRAHGGSVSYHPNVPNGARFDILLPIPPQ